MTNVNKLYCVERVGWCQWEGEDDRLVKFVEDARTYETKAEAQDRVDTLNAKGGADDSGDYKVVLYRYDTSAY